MNMSIVQFFISVTFEVEMLFMAGLFSTKVLMDSQFISTETTGQAKMTETVLATFFKFRGGRHS